MVWFNSTLSLFHSKATFYMILIPYRRTALHICPSSHHNARLRVLCVKLGFLCVFSQWIEHFRSLMRFLGDCHGDEFKTRRFFGLERSWIFNRATWQNSFLIEVNFEMNRPINSKALKFNLSFTLCSFYWFNGIGKMQKLFLFLFLNNLFQGAPRQFVSQRATNASFNFTLFILRVACRSIQQ